MLHHVPSAQVNLLPLCIVRACANEEAAVESSWILKRNGHLSLADSACIGHKPCRPQNELLPSKRLHTASRHLHPVQVSESRLEENRQYVHHTLRCGYGPWGARSVATVPAASVDGAYGGHVAPLVARKDPQPMQVEFPSY
jgi:hypothetical protein